MEASGAGCGLHPLPALSVEPLGCASGGGETPARDFTVSVSE